MLLNIASFLLGIYVAGYIMAIRSIHRHFKHYYEARHVKFLWYKNLGFTLKMALLSWVTVICLRAVKDLRDNPKRPH